MKCLIHNVSPSWAYKRYKCRCKICLTWKREVCNKTNDKERARERSRVWRIKNPERSRSNSKSYQKRYPEQLLKWQLKKYGITLEEYNKLLLQQDNKCAICGGPPSGMLNFKARFSVDHDHTTGKVRGLLCGNCNIGLGHFNDSIELLQKAIIYLTKENGDVY